LKEAVVEQQIKISKLERQGSASFSNLSIAATLTKAAYTSELGTPDGRNTAEPEPSVLCTDDRREAEKRREKERYEKEVQEKTEREERDRVQREESEAQEKRDREERGERERQERANWHATKECEERERKEQEERAEKERIEREASEQAECEAKERVEREVREQAGRQAKEREEQEAVKAQERSEREAKEQAERAAREKMDRTARKRAMREAALKAEQEAKEKAEREAKERAEETRVNAEKNAKQKAAKEAKEQAAREAMEKAVQEAGERAEKEAKEKREREEKEKLKREEKEKAERGAKEKTDREAKEREEEVKKNFPASRTPGPSAWGSIVGKNDRSRKTSDPSEKEQKNEWAIGRDSNSTKKEPSDLPPIITSSIPAGIPSDLFATGQTYLPGEAGKVEVIAPLTKKGKKGIDDLFNLSKVAAPTEPADFGRLDTLEDLNMNMSARGSISSENDRFIDAEQGSSPAEPTHPGLIPEIAPEALPSTSKTPKDAKEDGPTTPKPWPALSLTSAHQVPTLTPAKPEPEKPLSLWERKKLGATTQPVPAFSLFDGGDSTNSSGGLGEAGGSGRNTESTVMPTLVGDHRPIFTDTARDQRREDQRENLVRGFLGSNPTRRRNDSAQSQMTAKPVTKPAPAPAPPQKSGGWGSWGSSLASHVAGVATAERSPSPEPPLVKPKVEGPPRGFTPNQPPKSQPAGFGSVNNPVWGAGWGAAKTSPAPIAQKTSTGPAWGAKPTGRASGPTMKPPESSPDPAWLENIAEYDDEGPNY
jgi:hypothetical protein